MSNRVSRKEIVTQLVESGAFETKVAASSALEAVLDVISANLEEGNDVTFVGFGTFAVAGRAARTARNPQNGEPIQVPARKVVRFKVGSELKKAVA